MDRTKTIFVAIFATFIFWGCAGDNPVASFQTSEGVVTLPQQEIPVFTTSVEFTPTAIVTRELNKKVTITVTEYRSNGEVINGTPSLVSGDPSIARIAGEVEVLKYGETTVTASYTDRDNRQRSAQIPILAVEPQQELVEWFEMVPMTELRRGDFFTFNLHNPAGLTKFEVDREYVRRVDPQLAFKFKDDEGHWHTPILAYTGDGRLWVLIEDSPVGLPANIEISAYYNGSDENIIRVYGFRGTK